MLSHKGPIVRNAMTIDVEDYFQVSAFAAHIARDSWDSQPCRVERNIARILALLDEHQTHATFFTLGWIAERYPQLRASEVFMDLQRRISTLEEQIAHRREFYNAAVNINNVRIEQFPDSLLASLAQLVRRPLFETIEGERVDVDVGARLAS